MKKLVISPHIDDEILGCFSVLDSNTLVVYCGIDENRIVGDWVKPRPSQKVRLNELTKVSKLVGFQYLILDNPVNFFNLQTLISSFEKIINDFEPDKVFIPNPSYNQDHRTVYEAMLTALRPHDINFFCKKVLIYEQIQDLWNQNYHTFNPLYFISLSVNDKIKAYKVYKSQVREFRSADMIMALSRLRGAQSNLAYAEAFEVIRWVE